MSAMKRISTCLLFFALLLSAFAQNGTPILERRISVKIIRQPLGKALDIIAETAQFSFSYNSSVLKASKTVSVMAEQRSVREILDQLFNGELSYQQIGRHLVLQKKPVPKNSNSVQGNSDKPVKYNYTITGYIRDQYNGDGISGTSVFERQTLAGTLAGDFGYYRLMVSSRNERIQLRFSRNGYRDTAVWVRFQNSGIAECHISLQSLTPEVEMQPATDDTLFRPSPPLSDTTARDSASPTLVWQQDSTPVQQFRVEDTRAGKWLISAVQKISEKNIRDSFHRNWQVTLLPPLASNGILSGLVVNRLSWNIIAGYNGGLEGVEFGGLLNVLRKDMRGAQFSGFGNVVGGQVDGAQFSGFFNHNLGQVNALQAAGFYNYNNTLMPNTGVQMAGFINLNRSALTGAQGAGFMNIAGAGTEGVQASGFMNICEQISGVQAAGFMNISGGSSTLVQAAGFMNIAERMEGLQAAGFMNIAGGRSRLTQLAGFMNITDESDGGQIAGFLNIARKVRGFQIGIFNVADTVEGVVLGLFNFVGNGLHQLEFSGNELGQYGIAYRSGMERFHSIAGMTAQWPGNDSGTLITQGFGLGTRLRFSNALRLTADLSCHQLTVNLNSSFLNLQNRLNLSLEYRPFKGFALFGGFAFNHFLNDTRDWRYDTRFKDLGGAGIWQYDGRFAQKLTTGFQAGIRLF